MSHEFPNSLLSATDTAAMLGLSMPTLRRMTKARALPFVRIGARVLFERDNLQEWIVSHRVAAAQQGTANGAKVATT